MGVFLRLGWGIVLLSLLVCHDGAPVLAAESSANNLLLPEAMQGTWANKNGSAASAYNAQQTRKAGVSSLQLKYDVALEKQEAGFWFGLIGKDLSKYGAVTFWVKGEKGGEVFKIGLKDGSWFEDKLDAKAYLPGGVTTEWQKVTIPLSDFKAIKDWYNMDNFSVTFHHDYGQPYSGVIYVESLVFEGKREGVGRQPILKAESPPLKSLSEEQFLDLIERSAAMFFWNEANPANGLIKDICKTMVEDDFPMASIASVGFGLPALCVAESRGWLPKEKVYERVLTTLKFFRDNVENVHGFYYHFLNMKTGERWGLCELSSIDTTLLIAGVVFAGEYFKGTEVETLAKELYERVDWQWMMDNGSTPSMGWTPEQGFLPYRWNSYSEQMVLNILGIGAGTHPMPVESWSAFARPAATYKKFKFIGPPPLFIHQYSHIFIDFKDKEDDYMNYFENSVQATLANRQWCIDNMGRGKSYGPDSWGLTACDGPDGYKAYGAPDGENDGTVAPTAAIGSIIFTPELSVKLMKYLYVNHKDRIWGKYGFVDSFNWDKNWVSSRYIGIDEGPIVLMIENYRTGMVWEYFMRNENVKKALDLCGLGKSRATLDTVDLSGKWYFRTGDDLEWAKESVAGKDWKLINVPSGWETQSFDNYDGYGWYIHSFKLPEDKKETWKDKDAKIILNIGGIDDADQIFFNGRLIGQSGKFPPDYQTAWDKERNYQIPFEAINFKTENIIAVRVYDSEQVGGIWRGPVQMKVVK